MARLAGNDIPQGSDTMMKYPFQLAVFCAVFASVQASAPDSTTIYERVRSGSVSAISKLLDDGVPVNFRDAAGNSLLMQAVVYGEVELVKLLLDRGADVNATNKAGATALMRAAGNDEKIEVLLKHGADVNARSALGNTPLLVTSRAPGAASSVERLLKAGAEVNVTNVFGASPLMAASASGDLESARLLIKHGADVNAHSRGSEPTVIWGGGRSPLTWAAFRGDQEMAKLLLDSGAEINSPEGFGSALSQAAWNDHVGMAEFLLTRGAVVNQPDPMNEFTALHWAAGSEREGSALVDLLLRHGANPNAEGGAPVDAFMGIPQTPILIAKKRNETAITRALRAAGAKEKPEKTSEQPTASKIELSDAALRAALRMAIPPLEETATFSKGAYLRHSSKQDCVSCHQQYMPLTSFAFARAAGAPVSNSMEKEVLEMVRRDNTNLYEITAQATFHPEPGHAYGYTLLSLAAQEEPPSPEVDAIVHHLLVIQDKEGQWHNNLPRPPIQTSDVAPTALAIHALKKYGLPGRQGEMSERIERARRWLARVKPANTEERAYQLLGLAWAGEAQEHLHALAKDLFAEQREDGGWAQLPTLETDSYATGLSLFALAQATCTETSEFRRGLAFLLGTQSKDGTWHVQTRAYPFQPTMRSGYPYSRDSWISATGASWAAMAISAALQDRALEVSAR